MFHLLNEEKDYLNILKEATKDKNPKKVVKRKEVKEEEEKDDEVKDDEKDEVEEYIERPAPDRPQGGFGSIRGTSTSGGFGSIKGRPQGR